jgi:hypothetical protein
MWIHLPSKPSAYVADTAELSLDSEALSLLERSATWKTSSVSQASWRRVWKTVPSIRRLSGLTSPPSTLNRGVAAWASSLAASPASHTVSRAESSAKQTPGSYQERSSESPPDWDTQTSFLKMFPVSSDFIGTTFDPDYERWVTKLRRVSSQRQRLAPPTGGNDSSSWPTVTQDSATMRDKPYAQGGTPLTMVAGNWRTPASAEPGLNPERVGEFQWGRRNYDEETGRLAQIGLTQQAKAWPTPNTMDGLPPRSEEANRERFTTGQRAGRTTPDNLREYVQPEMHPTNWPTPQNRDYKSHDAYEDGTNLARKQAQGWTEDLNTKVVNWPTPGAHEDRADKYTLETSQRHQEEGRQVHLSQVVKMNWPTPRVSDTEGGISSNVEMTGSGFSRTNKDGVRWGAKLKDAAPSWPTPTATERSGTNPNTGTGEGLSKQAKGWPTPMASDENDRQKSETWEGNQDLPSVTKTWAGSHSSHPGPETPPDGSGSSPDTPDSPPPTAKRDTTCSPGCRRLNPNFAEWLMGLPVPGWTDDSAPLGTG